MHVHHHTTRLLGAGKPARTLVTQRAAVTPRSAEHNEAGRKADITVVPPSLLDPQSHSMDFPLAPYSHPRAIGGPVTVRQNRRRRNDLFLDTRQGFDQAEIRTGPELTEAELKQN